ncbi:hypothetical protein HPB49_018411 [Dermacentor silvarum]|uniref:Uncharacterized protein n=1 Tax=Dermacentor silvarum TaxID=543639 RepID=A0ACB8DQS8_DERSI|nr:hypothetical protein HPB49_018411 [Dermacentor silvarum]
MADPRSDELRPESVANSPTAPPNATAGAVQGKKQAGQKKKQHHQKKAKHGDDNKHQDADEGLKPILSPTKVRVRSPVPPDEPPKVGATILQPITPKSLTRSLSAEGYRKWRPLVTVVVIAAAASFGVVFAFYLRQSRKDAIEHCASVECKLAFEDLASLVDSQVSPCDDFHSHVCGRSGDKTFGNADLTERALGELLLLVQRLLLSPGNKDDQKHPGIAQLATTFGHCYAFTTLSKTLADAPLAEAIASETDILATTDVESVLRRVVRLSLTKGISTLYRVSVTTYLGNAALHVSRGESLSEKLGKQTDGASLQEFVARLFDAAVARATKLRQLDAGNAVLRLLKFDESLRPESGYARDEELADASKPEFMTRYVGGRDWMGVLNSLLPAESQLKETSHVLVSEADAIKKSVDELRKDIDLGVIYILLHVATEIGRFYTIPLSQATKTCLQVAQEVLPPVLSNVFNNLTASATSDPSRANAIFFRVRKVFAKHPLKQGMSEEDRKNLVSLLININLHAHRTRLGIWPNGSGWQPTEATESASATFPQIYGTLKAREALRRLNDPPFVEQVTFRRALLASDAAFSRLLNEIFIPVSLRRMPVLYSGEVPTEFDMGTVGEWYEQNVGAFGRCVKQSKASAIAAQFDALPPNRLHELFARTYSLRIVHRVVSDHYDGYRYARNFDAVWKEAQRTLFRRFCLLSCGGSGRNRTGESQLDCLVPVTSMPEFYEAFESHGPTVGADGALLTSRSMRAVPLLWCRQLYIILWKNVYVKRISRHYLTTVLEVALMVTLLLGIQEDSVVREPMVRRGDTMFDTIKTDAFWNTQKDIAHIDTVYFAPKSKYLSALTRSAFGPLHVRKVIEVPTEQQLVERARDDASFGNGTPAATSVLLLYTNYVDANDTAPVSLHVRMYAGRLPFDLQVLYQQRLISQPEGPVAEERFPEMNTLLPVMGALQQRHLELQAERFGYAHPVDQLTLQRFPFPSYLEYKDTKNYALVLTRFCIGMLIPFSFFVARLSDEKANGEGDAHHTLRRL